MITEWHELFVEGRRLSAEAVNALESSLATNPDDLRAHVQLLGYYFVDEKRFLKEWNGHALWLIAHHPEVDLSPFVNLHWSGSPEVHSEARRLWRVALERQSGNPAVLKAASRFFEFADPVFAKELLRRGAELEPQSAHWHESIGKLCISDARRAAVDSARVEGAREALVAFQKALELESSDEERCGFAINAADAACFADDHERATAYAEQLLAEAPRFDGTWIQGKAFHHGRIVLGRVALARGDTHSAKEHLLASVQGLAWPPHGSFSLDQVLAIGLAAHGERDAVLAYVEVCKHRCGVGLGSLGFLFRPPDGESPRLHVVRDDGENP